MERERIPLTIHPCIIFFNQLAVFTYRSNSVVLVGDIFFTLILWKIHFHDILFMMIIAICANQNASEPANICKFVNQLSRQFQSHLAMQIHSKMQKDSTENIRRKPDGCPSISFKTVVVDFIFYFIFAHNISQFIGSYK